MPTDLIIRPEREDDHDVIGAVIDAAFAGKPYADGDEADLMVALRREDAVSVSLVAELNGDVVGQVAFSPAGATDGAQAWYALGPVAVLPAHQGVGIGSRLIRDGLEIITGQGADGCILVGDPRYYIRFGFELAPENTPAGQPAEYFQVKLFGGRRPDGPITFHTVFDGAA